MALARLCWQNRIETATVTASAAAATGFPIANIKDWRSYLRSKLTGAAPYYFYADYGAPVSSNSFALAGHDLFTQGASVALDYSDVGVAGPWTNLVASFPVPSNLALARFYPTETHQYQRLQITGAAAAPEIGVWFVGNYLEFPLVPESPIDPDAQDILYEESIGGDGHLLGRAEDFVTRNQDWTFPLLTQAWLTGTWLPFWDAQRLKPFFWVWDYVNFPLEVYLMRMKNKEQRAPWEGTWRSLTFQLEGLKGD